MISCVHPKWEIWLPRERQLQEHTTLIELSLTLNCEMPTNLVKHNTMSHKWNEAVCVPLDTIHKQGSVWQMQSTRYLTELIRPDCSKEYAWHSSCWYITFSINLTLGRIKFCHPCYKCCLQCYRNEAIWHAYIVQADLSDTELIRLSTDTLMKDLVQFWKNRHACQMPYKVRI